MLIEIHTMTCNHSSKIILNTEEGKPFVGKGLSLYVNLELVNNTYHHLCNYSLTQDPRSLESMAKSVQKLRNDLSTYWETVEISISSSKEDTNGLLSYFLLAQGRACCPSPSADSLSDRCSTPSRQD